MSKGIVITGATGKQGGATIDALISSPSHSSDFTILAVTRNPSSASATALQNKSPAIKLVTGDLNDVPGIFNAAEAIHKPIHGVFSVQTFAGQGQSVDTEEKQGKALIDEALKRGVNHFVYTSVDRGGDKSLDNPTNIPHFRSKHNIERHLVDSAKDSNMSYTILRPTAFMDNWVPGFMGKMFGAMWTSALAPDRKLQLISTKDIGFFAAQAFRNPDRFNNRAVSLAGDELTFAEASKVWQDTVGYGAPATYSFMGGGLMWAVKELGTMFRWFETDGYQVDIPALKKEHPGLQTLGDWIEKESAFKKQ
ncbi:NAD(P)-binding protein [Aureobasidium pullulans]|uniref:NAD(P)-binding protein n=1 Tax=Aureobasidium pullulans TaxID=5580 RepID=A0A4S8Z3R6_AURPU|nr:NAD(P)-binding protein [Aureobasidium pullulans]